ncbi:uncharacterized protein LOC126687756 [Mercurialis annua]|uniref:uncharacterized protein LOC126687756 n=1 Tax=Mercurialis annua TaxID=3986 RepID=UPI002160E432|nr:uncharacterized protein LOC126687756 [Mercurialis annua]
MKRQDWLRSGDKNTKFFHAKTKKRQRMNAINGIRDSTGSWDRLTSRNPTGIANAFAGLDMKVTDHMNNDMTKTVTPEEVAHALFSIHPSKAPKVFGFTGFFYHNYSYIIGEEITKLVIEFFNRCRFLKSLNHTVITLIPKEQVPTSVKDFRPINLCSVYYKIISKILTTRLQKTWGFDERVIGWILECITSISYSILIKGEPKDFFQPSRGLRQGEPLSLLIFVLCAEGLSHLIKREISNQQLTEAIRRIMDSYGTCSGQIINLEKSSVCFSRNTGSLVQQNILSNLKLYLIKAEDKYLGLSTQIQRSKNITFAGLLTTLQNKHSGWKEQFLSQGEKEILIKAVLMAITVYAMMCFFLPKSLCSRINS